MEELLFFLGFFGFCLVIGIATAISGTGGGVLFTPLVLSFTCIDSYVVRATGLFVALVGALSVARPFLRLKIANIRLVFFAGAPCAVFSYAGAFLAGHVKDVGGDQGEAFLRGALGVMLIVVGLIYGLAGRKTEYPEVRITGRFTRWLGLSMAYREDSLGQVLDYKVTRAGVCVVFFCGVGLVSGFFGLGAGWGMVPIFNLVMMAPLKVAAASARVLIGLGGSAGIWPYVTKGALIPVFVVPCLAGSVIGSLIGARLMPKIKAHVVRRVLSVVMIATAVKLVIDAVRLCGI